MVERAPDAASHEPPHACAQGVGRREKRHLVLNKPLFIVALLLMCATRAFAWGHEGHRIIAGIAQDRLTPAARAEVQRLMGTDQLANFATWADDIRPQRRGTAPWHYVNIPSSAKNYDSQRDCLEGDCVVEKLKQFSATLRDARQPLLARQEALKWVIHLTGDIHQPFHAIADARGGNDVPIQEVGSSDCGRYPCELHALWDTDMLRHMGLRERRYVLQLEELIDQQHLQASGDPEQWANESFRDAKAAWVDPGTNIDGTYFERKLPVLNERLAIAGLRLAALLNADLKGP